MADNNIYVSVVEKDSPNFSCRFTDAEKADAFMANKQAMGYSAIVTTKEDGFYLRNSYLSNW